jgi:putative membrane protein
MFLVLGVVSAIDLLRQPRDSHAHENHEGHDHSHDHDHQHGHAPSWSTLAIVAIPLALGVLVPARPLGASAISTSGVPTSLGTAPVASVSTQFDLAPTDRNVLDWIRAFSSANNIDEFAGQSADLVGFVYRDVRFKADSQFMVARFTVSCCVADASAIGVIVESPDGAKVAQDSWVHVKGQFKVEEIDGQRAPVLIAESIETVPQPEHPYLYP